MGLAIDREHFEPAEYPRFVAHLRRSLTALRALMERPGFGAGAASIGAELELCLVDESGGPLPLNLVVIDEAMDPRLTVELDRFNLECNLRPTDLAGRPFTALAGEIDDALARVRRAAGRHGGRVAAIGILPTLSEHDLQSSAMTDLPRYRALSAGIQRLRGEPFHIVIDGDDPLDLHCEDLTFEGAATSLQLHLRVEPAAFRDLYNAVQLATGPVLAVSGNSPLFLGHRLWHETRVALFKQAVDPRSGGDRDGHVARVSFGSRWLQTGPLELFEENVTQHAPLLPILGDEDPLACIRAGDVPRLEELRLHQGTVWRWNRVIYDPVAGGHLRIEMRALPAGPTTVDMVANAAFLIGLARAIAEDTPAWLSNVPFRTAEDNFYRAAQIGIEAELHWPAAPGGPLESVPARTLAERLLPMAERGLRSAGIEQGEITPLLDVVAGRAGTGQSGACWQRGALDPDAARALDSDAARALDSDAVQHSRRPILNDMLEQYLAHSEGGEPVHRWPAFSR